MQAEGLEAPSYRIASQTGPDHDKHFKVEVLVEGKVIAEGEGRNKQAASKVAAARALEDLNAENIEDSSK